MARYWCLLHYLFLVFFSYITHAQSFISSTANVSTSWGNNSSTTLWKRFKEGPEIRIVVDLTIDPVNEDFLHVAFGFYRVSGSSSFLLGVVLYHEGPTPIVGVLQTSNPKVIWSANRNYPVGENSTLEFTGEGDLILRDVDDTLVWSTNTSGRSIVGLQVTKMGNLVLYDYYNGIIWQSFDHPTDTLVLGQNLMEGQKLIANASSTNWMEGLYSLFVTDKGLFASFNSSPPICYFQDSFVGKNSKQPSFVRFENGGLSLYIFNPGSGKQDDQIRVTQGYSFQYLQLGSDGHLRAYKYMSQTWVEAADVLSDFLLPCSYPEGCGSYGICSDGQCSCPDPSYFRPVNNRKPGLGCSATTPLSCETSQYHHLLDLNDLAFSNHAMDSPLTNLESCKEACLKNCSCKLAFFERQGNDSHGRCLLQSSTITLVAVDRSAGWSAYIKVQGSSPPASPPPSQHGVNGAKMFHILGIISGILLIAVLLILSRKLKSLAQDHTIEDSLSKILTRFSFKELKEATNNFCTKLGEGGFGSVYKGTLVDGTVIAVKRLDGLGRVKQSFLAEVETMGHLHHINLVRLVGFCAQNSHRLLVYEYMCNGSLDKWIFEREPGESLAWKTRQKIISGLAKGLNYLQEDCQPQILHLDIKPQNILLDENFNAKVSDFGISKFMGKDRSKVMTALRGTPGYLAPERLGFVITDKVDVYSFGIVVLEILCGRRIFDLSKPEECTHLLDLLEKKAEDNQLHDMIDDHCHDMKQHEEEVLRMLKLSAWCIQSDPLRRPTMSMVLKVFEGVTDIEPNLQYKFTYTAPFNIYVPENKDKRVDTTLLLHSALSGP